jgi:protein TonB
MSPHVDILEQPERLSRSFAGSILFHGAIVAALVVAGVLNNEQAVHWGGTGGGIGQSVAVTPVSKIPLPRSTARENPVANPTESQVPTPPPKAKPEPKPKEKPPEPDAIPLKGRAEKANPRDYSARNTFREKQVERRNQLYSPVGEAASTPMIGMNGAGSGVTMGDNTPFGTQFGWYAKLLRDKVTRSWQSSDLDQRIQNVAAVTFTLHRDGSATGVRISQPSGNASLDFSAQRAILDAAPFPPLPQQFSGNSVTIEMRFSLK